MKYLINASIGLYILSSYFWWNNFWFNNIWWEYREPAIVTVEGWDVNKFENLGDFILDLILFDPRIKIVHIQGSFYWLIIDRVSSFRTLN